MANVEYPKTLTQGDWDKKKPILAKTKSTGIGKALKALKALHDGCLWEQQKVWAKAQAFPSALEKARVAKKAELAAPIKAIIAQADVVDDLALKWAGLFKADKLIPKSAVTAATNVSTAAKAYVKELRTVDKQIDSEAALQHAALMVAIKAALGPTIKSLLEKVDRFLSDISKLRQKSNEENFFKLVLGDGGARGYATALQAWDKAIKPYKDIADPIFTGDALTTFKPAIEDYAAGHDRAKWEKKLDKMAIEKKCVFEDTFVHHADYLGQQVANIKTFRGYLVKAEKALKA